MATFQARTVIALIKCKGIAMLQRTYADMAQLEVNCLKKIVRQEGSSDFINTY